MGALEDTLAELLEPLRLEVQELRKQVAAPPPLPRLTVSVAEAASMLGVSESLIRSMISNGSLHSVQPQGLRRHLIRVQDLEALVA